MAKLRAGIDLGGTKVQAIIADARHKIVGEARYATPTTGGADAVVGALVAAVKEAAELAGVETAELAGVGLGAPGDVDDKKGTIDNAGNLAGFDHPVPVAAMLKDELGVPVVRMGNDVSVATAAEFELGAGRPFRSLLGVFWGTGVGGGLILDGQEWSGRGGAGEIGHMVVKVGGRRCTCGREGCMEAYAGRAAMEARARKLHDDGRRSGVLKLEVTEAGEITGTFTSDKDGREYEVQGKAGTPKHAVSFTIKYPATTQTFTGYMFTGDGRAIAGTTKMLEREAGFYAERMED